MKKYGLLWLFVFSVCLMTGCHRQESPYNREDPDQTYERYITSHIFAACSEIGKPYATYSLATLNKRPSDDNDYYKVTFVNGPCKGKVLFTKDVILKTEPVENGFLRTGTVVLRNYDNPKDPYDKEQSTRWHKAVVIGTQRQNQNIVELAFPRDKNDFSPARESIYLHNIRYILEPEPKDIRTFL